MTHQNVPNEGHTDYFRAQFLRAFITLLCPAVTLFYGGLWLKEGAQMSRGGALVAGGVMAIAALVWTRRLIVRYPVLVNPAGLRVYGLRGGLSGDQHWIAWTAITRATPRYVVFCRYLVVRTHNSRRRYWIPLSLADARRFRDVVTAYTSRVHPVARVLYE